MPGCPRNGVDLCGRCISSVHQKHRRPVLGDLETDAFSQSFIRSGHFILRDDPSYSPTGESYESYSSGHPRRGLIVPAENDEMNFPIAGRGAVVAIKAHCKVDMVLMIEDEKA